MLAGSPAACSWVTQMPRTASESWLNPVTNSNPAACRFSAIACCCILFAFHIFVTAADRSSDWVRVILTHFETALAKDSKFWTQTGYMYCQPMDAKWHKNSVWWWSSNPLNFFILCHYHHYHLHRVTWCSMRFLREGPGNAGSARDDRCLPVTLLTASLPVSSVGSIISMIYIGDIYPIYIWFLQAR